jgi:hypothetical protein
MERDKTRNNKDNYKGALSHPRHAGDQILPAASENDLQTAVMGLNAVL